VALRVGLEPGSPARCRAAGGGLVSRAGAAALVAGVVAAAVGATAGCDAGKASPAAAVSRGPRESPRVPPAAATRTPPAAATVAAQPPLSPAARERVERFCSACHPLPAPANFPRLQWPQEVRLGFDLWQASLRTDLAVPSEAEAIRYFQEGAPERLDLPRAADRPESAAPLVFERVEPTGMVEQPGPAIAQVTLDGAPSGGGAAILTTDMRSGEIRRWHLDGSTASSSVVAAGGHPCRLTPVPGAAGRWFVGDLGSYMPEDHDFGSVAILEPSGEGAQAAIRPIREGLSRVVEALPIDFDGTGPADLLVLEFGWRRSGALRVLLGAGEGGPATGQRVLDPRHGCLAARVVDLDRDGHADVVAAFAQEHETVDVWYGGTPGAPDHRQVHRLPDPSWGSSGLDVADLDGDGDADIIHINGDTMDSGLPRANHGIRVLWNDGGRAFRVEEVAVMPGISQAAAADLDGDGDQDLVAAAFHPSEGGHPPGTFDSLLWVEKTPDGWKTHAIERDRCEHAAFALADVDGDGRTDLVAGTFRADPASPRPLLTVWLNRRRTD